MKKVYVLLLFLVALSFKSNAQNEKFKALFLYNFTKYVDWPTSQKTGDFIIGVLGNSSISDALNTIASKQMVGNQKISVKVFSKAEDIDQCNIVFIPASKSSSLGAVLSKVSGKHVLVIGDKAGMASQGASLNFLYDGDKLKYEVNKANIERHGLAVNPTLISLGIEVR
jgi:hypothetical protein